MLSVLPAFILIPLSFLLFCINLSFCGSLVFLGGLLKFLIPLPIFHQLLHKPMHSFYRLWTLINFIIVSLCNKVEWQITGDENLDKSSWYLIIANHQSWLDIFVLTHFARTRIPEPKFFLKESLKKVPFVGMACWALNMPFMRRYSKSFIEKHPHLKGKDIETTRKSCQQYKHTPTTIINFVEGTRFTQEKKQEHFNYILPPKAGGIAFTLAAMGSQFNKILNITLVYPDNRGHVMKDMFSGKLKRVVVQVEQIEISDEVIGDYYKDSQFKSGFQQWLNEQWKNKDQLISTVLSNK